MYVCISSGFGVNPVARVVATLFSAKMCGSRRFGGSGTLAGSHVASGCWNGLAEC